MVSSSTCFVLKLFNLIQSGHVLIIWWGTPCTSFSVARRWDGGPPPLRSEEDPDLPGCWLSDHDVAKVLAGNALADLTAEGIVLGHRHHVYSVLENPATSRIWDYTPIKQALIASGASHVITDYCGWGMPWQKSTRLSGTLPNLCSLSRRCAGGRLCSFSGRPHRTLRGQRDDGVWWTLVAQPYPEALCMAAVACFRLALAAQGSRP